MANSLNKCQFIGRLGKDAETRFTTTNQSVTSFSIATDHSYKGKDGNWVNETTWVDVVGWGLSDYVKNNLAKGKRVYVEGRLQKRDYEDKQGIKRYITEIVSEKIMPLDAKEGSTLPASNELTPAGADVSGNDNDDLPF